MNSHNGRAEEAATLADTIERQKHGLFSGEETKASQSESSKWKQERKKESEWGRRGEAERENEWDEERTSAENRPTNLHYLREEAQLFHADRFRRGSPAGRAGNDVGFRSTTKLPDR